MLVRVRPEAPLKFLIFVSIKAKIPLPHALIWDWDGTVVDSHQLIKQAFLKVANDFSLSNVQIADAEANLGSVALSDYFPDLFGELEWLQAKDKFYEFITARHLSYLSPINGSVEFIKMISQQYPNISQAVVSNKRGDLLRLEVSALELTDTFVNVIGAGDFALSKPNAELVKIALGQADLSHNSVIYVVGDSQTDINLARNACLKAIFYGENLPKDSDDVILANFCNYQELTSVFGLYSRLH
ncbi:MAG: HAD-IA family hydrolase [Pseudomonadota bacterium]